MGRETRRREKVLTFESLDVGVAVAAKHVSDLNDSSEAQEQRDVRAFGGDRAHGRGADVRCVLKLICASDRESEVESEVRIERMYRESVPQQAIVFVAENIQSPNVLGWRLLVRAEDWLQGVKLGEGWRRRT
jgi:hypothetical protein